MAIYDISGKEIVTGNSGGSDVTDGTVTPEKTSFMKVYSETIKSDYEDLLNAAGLEIVPVTGTQYGNGMTYGYVTSGKITLPAGTYYYYSVAKTTSGVSPQLWVEGEDGSLTDVTSDIATIANKSGFEDGSYNEYHNENTPNYQPNGAGYFFENTIVISEGFIGYIRFGAGGTWYGLSEPGYTYLFTKRYNPFKDSLVDVTTERLFLNEEQAAGFIEELCKNPTMAEQIASALPVFAVPNSYGKYWYHIGDSNSQWMGGSVLPDETDTGFLLTAARKNGIAKFKNASTAGAAWGKRDDDSDAYCGVTRVDELVASGDVPDIITILLGTNSDLSNGTVDDAVTDLHTTCSAVKYCLEKLLQAFPTTAIGVMLPMQRAETYTAQETKNALIKELCEYYSIPTLDLFHEGQVVPDSKLTAYNDGHEGVKYTDAAHITTTNGVAQLGRKISEWLNRI